ncbi:MAG: hypothetical protein A2W91_13275 [Bacteroidetes bacterium GWF2_38_335]|nr:MAG: hypothetical protein A2W91_13275 [Bacteroidetes bacterium GWF2_38_335]OFY77226.1 MAG: hypothetical protein A2281_14940 [Bacteroidetes bacterium RIFOXYA12_FULL_38_20]HBS85773.1 hypothetical protein [Bacteroidales bacterium]
MEAKNQIELRSKDVRDIIGKIPPIVIRFGIAAIFIVLLTLFICAGFLRQPDYLTVESEVFYQNNTAKFVLKVPPEVIRIVEVGQKVLIEIDQYPESEFGYLIADVDSIDYNSFISNNKDFYDVFVYVDLQLFSKFPNKIPLQNLSFNSQINTGNKTVLQKIFNF